MPRTTEILQDAFVAARRDHSLVAMASLPVPETLTEALGVQAAVAEQAGLAHAGWKVAIAADGSPVIGLMPGPYFAPGGTHQAAIGADVLIEIELGLRLAQDMPARPGEPYTREELLAHCDKVFLGIEIVESRMSNWTDVPYPLWLADALGHGGYLVGPALDATLLDHFAILGCFVALNGVTLHDRPAIHGNGDPLVPVLAWANRQSDVIGSLRAGQIITTGSLCGGVLCPGKGDVVTRLGPTEIAFTLV